MHFERELQAEYKKALKQEEIIWFQKSRENWVKCGDRNTQCFHAQTVIHRKLNKIHKLKRPDGTWCTDAEELRGMVQDYYNNLFSSPPLSSHATIMTSPMPRVSEEG